jgi:hypothetical protein
VIPAPDDGTSDGTLRRSVVRVAVKHGIAPILPDAGPGYESVYSDAPSLP